MRHLSRWTICLGMAAAAAFSPANKNTLLVGEHKLSASALSQKIARVGKILGQDNKGFFRVQPLTGKTETQLKSVLTEAGIDYVLPGTASEVVKTDLDSVQDHIRYARASRKIALGRDPRPGEETGVDFYEALEYYLSSRVDGNGKMNRDAYIRAAKHRDKMPAARLDMIEPGIKGGTAPVGNWIHIGPRRLDVPYQQYYGSKPVSGRKNGIAISKSNPSIMYTASAGGGIWKSTDGGANFVPLSDRWMFLHTNCVAVHPTNPDIVYAGTGDYQGMFAAQTFGIMRSTDGGLTWNNVGNSQFGDSVVTRIMISESTPTTLVALTAGDSGDIWRSTDSGATWASTNAQNSDWEDIDRSANGAVWIAVGSEGKKIARSTDQGATWTTVTAPASSGGSRFDVAVSKWNSQVIYLVCSNRKVFKTVDGGLGWIDLTPLHDAGCSDPAYNWSQSTYDIYVECSTNAGFDLVFVGLITITASHNGGTTWRDFTRSFQNDSRWHNDQHCMAVYPGNMFRVIAGGDGGLVDLGYDPASGNPTHNIKLNHTIYDTQMYAMAVHPTTTTVLMGGTQDNATPYTYSGSPDWLSLFAGDGGWCDFDKLDPGRHYTSSQGGGVYRYTTLDDTSPDDVSPGNGLFIAPMRCHAAGGSSLFYGSASGELRMLSGNSWNTHATGGGPIRTLAPSKLGVNRIYTGATNGDIFRTNTISTPFTKIDANLPDFPVGGIAESPFAADALIVGIQDNGPAAGVYTCPDVTVGSPSWTRVSGVGLTALPSSPVNDVERDPWNRDVYYAATDVGVFMSPDAGANWFNMNWMGLPNVHVNDLWIFDSGGIKYLYAATFGRGIWRVGLGNRFVTQLLLSKAELYGGTSLVGTVKLNGSAPVGAIASVTDSSPNVSTPTTVTIPQGSTQMSFNIFTINPAATETVTVSASIFGGTAQTNSFTLHKIPVFVFGTQPIEIYGGDSFTANIFFAEPAPMITTILFSDSSPFVSSPTATSIPVGGTTRTVLYRTLPVTSRTAVSIEARISTQTLVDFLWLNPRPVLQSLEIDPDNVAGGTTTQGTVRLDQISNVGDIVCTLTDSSTLVTTSGSVTISRGQLTKTFPISTAAVTATYTITVRANYNGVSRSDTFVLRP